MTGLAISVNVDVLGSLRALSWRLYFLSSTSQICCIETSSLWNATLTQVYSSMLMMAQWLSLIQTLPMHTKSCYKCVNTCMFGVANGSWSPTAIRIKQNASLYNPALLLDPLLSLYKLGTRSFPIPHSQRYLDLLLMTSSLLTTMQSKGWKNAGLLGIGLQIRAHAIMDSMPAPQRSCLSQLFSQSLCTQPQYGLKTTSASSKTSMLESSLRLAELHTTLQMN